MPWPTKKLVDLCELVRGSEPGRESYFDNSNQDRVRFIRVQDLTGKLDNPKFVNKNLKGLVVVKPEEILISFDGTPGIIAKGWSGAIASGIRVIRNVKSGILKDFLFYYLQTSLVQEVIKSYTTGVTILHASRAIPHIKILIPPLPVQQKIVERLDAIRKVQELNDKQIALADELFQSLLHRELKLRKDWKMRKLGEVGKFKRGPFGGSLKKEIFVEHGYKVYEQKNVIYNDFTLGNYFITEKKYKEMIDFAVHSGDLIISCSGTIGKVVKVPENIRPGIINQALLKITPLKNIIIADFLKFVIETPVVQQRLTLNTRGSAIRNVASVKEIQRIKTPLPPLETQKKIVEKLSAVQEYKKKLLKQKQLFQELFESVLNKLLKGRM